MIDFHQLSIPELNNNTIICFDIEVSSFWINDNNKIIGYDNTIPDDAYNKYNKGSCVYIWQLSIDDKVYYGREFNDFKIVIEELNKKFVPATKKDKLTIWVHNLGYEVQFLRSLIEFDGVFARSERKPIYANYKNIQFRCSYMLTNKSLATWGKELGIDKKVGDLDYKTLRTPLTKLTEKELGYCEYDLLIMIAGIKKYMTKFGSITAIPLTATGEIRRNVSNLYKNDKKHHFKITKMQPSTPNKYAIFKSIFAGGDCHTHIIYAGDILYNVGSEDITSDYPFQLIANMYPDENFEITCENENEWDFNKNAYIFHLKLYNITSKGTLNYLAYSRCKVVKDLVNDNGRIFSASFVDLWCTEQELPFIKKLYDIERMEVDLIYKARKNYLDTKFVKYILELYKNKTELKGAKTTEEIELYMSSKALLNSLYGLSVQDILQTDVFLDKSGWWHTPLTPELLQAKLNEVQQKCYKNNMAYTTGIWCTGYARTMLWEMLLKVGDDVCYYDTDSCKFLNPEKHIPKFDKKNKELIKKLEQALKHHKLDLSAGCPSKDGKQYPLGQWDFEGIYEQAVFLGAKKYAVVENGDIHITVSGVPKVASKCLSSLSDFREGFKFDREICDKNQSHYIDGDNYCGYMPDGYYLNQPYGLNIRPCGYTLDITNEYRTLINILK